MINLITFYYYKLKQTNNTLNLDKQKKYFSKLKNYVYKREEYEKC